MDQDFKRELTMSKFSPFKLIGTGSFRMFALSMCLLSFFIESELRAQEVPQSISYQAILRDSDSFFPISNQSVYLSVEFLDGPNGDVIYHEEFASIQTGESGLVNLRLGLGNELIGSFSDIQWEEGDIWLRVSVDSGSGLNILQETPFNTVPYAFYASSTGANSTDDDTDPLNEIQTLSLEGSALRISGVETPIDLSALPDSVNDLDSDPENELQDLELSENTLSITNSPNETLVDLSSYLDNTDNQALTLDGTVLSISGDPNSVDLIDLLGTGTDVDPLNELQAIELNGNELSITNDPSASPVDLSGYLDNTDNQDLTLSGSTLSLTGDGTEVNLSLVPGIGDDADIDPENELQEIELNSNSLNITNNPAATPVDLSGYLDNTDNQDLTLSGSTLSLTGDASDVDLSAFDQSELQENHIFLGNSSDEAEQVAVTGDLTLSNAGATVTGIQGSDVSATAPTNGQVLVYNAAQSEYQPRSPASITSTPATSYYSVDPLDFRELTDNMIGTDLEVQNGIKFFDDDAPFAMLRTTGIIEIMAPLHLPQGAVITNVKIYFRDLDSSTMRFTIYRKDMTDFNLSNEVISAGVVTGLGGDRLFDMNITNQNTVDNSTYSYRLYARFSDTESDDEVDIDDVKQVVYGAVIEYTTN